MDWWERKTWRKKNDQRIKLWLQIELVLWKKARDVTYIRGWASLATPASLGSVVLAENSHQEQKNFDPYPIPPFASSLALTHWVYIISVSEPRFHHMHESDNIHHISKAEMISPMQYEEFSKNVIK